MEKVKFRGFSFDARTVQMILWAEKEAGFKFSIAQGSYNTGGVAASAGTHDGGGAVDFSTRLILTAAKRDKMLKALKDAGFAAWYRTKAQGFTSNHIHAIAIGCRDLAPLAKSQVLAFDKNRDGLKSNEKDDSYRPSPKVKFDMKTNGPISRERATAAKKAPAKKAAPAKKTVKKAAPAKKAATKKKAK